MKILNIKYLILLISISIIQMINTSSFAQTPQKMSYQAVIRNADNQLVINHAVGIQLSIIQESIYGAAVYVETYTALTNINGLVTIEIGGGTVVYGSFVNIDWSTGIYFIKTEIDPLGGTDYSVTGISQMLSVPYAQYAKNAETANETDPVYNSWNKSTGININAAQVSNFQTSVTNNAAVLANTAKNSYPSSDATKLAGIQAGAEVNVNADWNATGGDAQIINKPSLSNVATSGSYDDLSNKPITDGSETKISAGTNVTVTGSGTSGSPYVIDSKKIISYFEGGDEDQISLSSSVIPLQSVCITTTGPGVIILNASGFFMLWGIGNNGARASISTSNNTIDIAYLSVCSLYCTTTWYIPYSVTRNYIVNSAGTYCLYLVSNKLSGSVEAYRNNLSAIFIPN